MRALVPQSAGDFAPAGGATCFPMVLNTWPMKPSGVQLAKPIFPPRMQTRVSSPAARFWSGVNITPKVETTTSKLASENGSASASAVRNSKVEPFGVGAFARPFEQRGDVVGSGHIAPAPRGGERDVPVLTPPNSLDAWGAHHCGLWHVYRFNKADNDRAQFFFEMAVRLDPTFARAYAGLSCEAAGQSVMAHERDPTTHWAMGRAFWLCGRHDQSLIEPEQQST